MESRVRLGGKEGHTNIQISAEPGSNWRPFGWKAEILPTAKTTPALQMQWLLFTHSLHPKYIVVVSQRRSTLQDHRAKPKTTRLQ